MLINLKIKNIALISECHVDFKKGLNIITGETGAGKSLLIDSLNFVLGERADKTLIKHGESFARVDAVFEVDVFDDHIKSFFDLMGMEAEDTVIISRQMNLEGKNECRINGEIVTVGMLKKLTNHLVDIHGQHEHQSLLDPKYHLGLLDQFDQSQLQQPLEQLEQLRSDLRDVNAQMDMLGGIDTDRARNIEILNYSIDEIEKAGLVVDEEETLESKRNLMQNSEKLYSAFDQVQQQLNGHFDVVTTMKSMINQMQSVAHIDEAIVDLKEKLSTIRYDFEDWQEQFLDYYHHLDYDENELNIIEDRLELIKDLKRKYGNSIEEILQYLDQAKEKRELYLHSEEELKKCIHKKNEILAAILDLCKKISSIRKDIASVVQQAILMELRDLGMYNASFEVSFADMCRLEEVEHKITSKGLDKVEFLFSANLGEPLKPLSKIISGGEMSRFMLAIKCVLNAQDYMKTLIFDEIDSGIGGKTGAMVGQKLYKLGLNNQIISITHLSSIACFADHHLKIEKSSDEEKTYTHLYVLEKDAIAQELMRMNGVDIHSNYGLLQAKEMLNDADQIKQHLMNAQK